MASEAMASESQPVASRARAAHTNTRDFLISIGVGDNKLEAETNKLQKAGYETSNEILAATEPDLNGTGIVNPVLRLIQQQQQSLPQQLQQQLEEKRAADNELREDVRHLKKLFVDSALKESRAVSYAEYYGDKSREGRVEEWHLQMKDSSMELPSFLNQAASNVGGEKSDVKPYWKKILEEHKMLSNLSNAYEIAYLGTKIPDIGIYPQGLTKPVSSDFVAAGDCKGDKWVGTSSSEKGQIMLYVHRMLDAQPMRQFAYGFVTNNRILVLVKGYREQVSPFLVRWCLSSVFDFEYGMKLWLQLMREDTGYRCPPVVENFPITFEEMLRPGGTCRAFRASYRGKPVVAKLYSDQGVALDNANRIKIASGVVTAAASATGLATLPEVVATEGKWSLITPQGTPLTRENFMKVHVDKLVHTLQVVHQAGIIHRDVRIANIFYLNTEQVLLNDWGSSVTAGEAVLYAGAPEPHIHPEIEMTDLYSPVAKHDLHALVSSFVLLLSPGVNVGSRKLLFKEAFEAAETCDYAGIALNLTSHMK
eukprot:CAMPEP_0119002848 /NCGR_PEP_ID=MMETSP1176-20130426/175_1 /TAXON_ID=265551 /ORGANISM="Synedropsis recta cf, Strain CCMP1620" /LENGTH=536 /DNA_ID=CAMNT_0006954379 /DNA_START=137 /DNA_END=1747 /DNA_ORIENTATION=-